MKHSLAPVKKLRLIFMQTLQPESEKMSQNSFGIVEKCTRLRGEAQPLFASSFVGIK
jgi:hypothetical protein